MGKLGANAMNVNGTGQTVGDMKNAGYNPQEIGTMGTTPNMYQRVARGGLQGIGQGLQRMDRTQAPGTPVDIPGGAAPVSADYFSPFNPNGAGTGQQGGLPNSQRARNPMFYGYGE